MLEGVDKVLSDICKGHFVIPKVVHAPEVDHEVDHAPEIHHAPEEFWFLNVDNNIPASSQGTSERTKNATDYLKTLLHPINPILEDSAGDQDLPDLSLNQILEGKTRAIAARMFFEVLVSLNVCF